jgi:hypothetical protein
MADEKNSTKKEGGAKSPILEKLFELLQWLFLGGLVLKKGGDRPQATGPGGQPEIEVPKVPAWIVSKFHLLTSEDEQEYDQIMDRFSTDPEDQMIFFNFKNHLVEEGYDEDHIRLMLVNLNRDWLNRKDAKKTDIPNSAIEFITQIYFLDGDYDAQKRMAKEKKFLEKTSPAKKLFRFAVDYKFETFVGIFMLPIGIIELIFWILK